MIDEKFGDILANNRQNMHLTQEELAQRIGVTPQAVSRWERGNGFPDVSMIPGICKVLKLSANELLSIDPVDFMVESKDIQNLE